MEDTSDEAFTKRHAALEAAERIRFQGADKKRRTNRASSSLPTTPEPTLTAPTSPMCSSQSLRSSPGDTPHAPSLLTVTGSQDDTSQTSAVRKSSRKTPSLSRSTSSIGDEPLQCCVAWEERVFPLTDAEVRHLQMEEQSSQQSSNAACCLDEPASPSQPEPMLISASASRASSNPNSPSVLAVFDTSPSSSAVKLGEKGAASPTDNWSARVPSPRAQGRDVEEKKPPLLVKFTKQLSASNQ